jgi:hypothetical protein
MNRPAERERHNPRVGTSNPNQSSWDWEAPYLGPPEAGQPRAGSAPPRQQARRFFDPEPATPATPPEAPPPATGSH